MDTIERTIKFKLSDETIKRIERLNKAAKELTAALDDLKEEDY